MRKVENIMQEFENIVIKCCQEVVSENHSDIEVDMDTCLTNELGFDSLGIVSLVLLFIMAQLSRQKFNIFIMN